MKILKGLKALNPAYQMFFISTLISCFFTVYLVAYLKIETLFSVMISIITLALIIIYLTKFAGCPSKWRKGDIILLLLNFIIILHLPVHFLSSARISFGRDKKDDLLIKFDKFMLGWLIKDGQIALWIDKNDYIGPHTSFGKFINNSLELFYFFYYLIPYVSMHFMSLLNCLREIIFRFNHDGLRSSSYKKNWNTVLFVSSVYLLTCVSVFFVNTLVPATSPRQHLKNEFVHPLELSGLSKYLNMRCKDDQSANSFPSGHVAEVVSIGLAYYIDKNKFVGGLIIFFSALIALATIFLRYHYFCDVVMGLILAFLSFEINYYFGLRRYMKNNKEEKADFKMMNDESLETMI
jgi:membrane-associated phospholipid phosphatase